MSDGIETIRQIWTPNREAHEIVDNLNPRTELDSDIRDLFCRIIEQHGPLTVNRSTPNTKGIKWHTVDVKVGNVYVRETSIWAEQT